MKNKSQRGISPRNNFAAKFRGGTRRKSIPVIMHKNQLTGVSRCFAAKKMAVTFFFCLFFNLILNLDVFISFQVVSMFCFCFNWQFCMIIVLVPTVSKFLLFKFHFNLYAFISFQVV